MVETPDPKNVAPPPQRASLWEVFKQTCIKWQQDDAPRLGAALAYYAIFSITPIIFIALTITSFFVGEEIARGEMQEQLEINFGKNGAQAITAMLGSAKKSRKSGVAALAIGTGTLLFAASGLFTELKESLNIIWGVKHKRSGVKAFVLTRFISFLMVLGIAVLLLTSILASTIAGAAIKYADRYVGAVTTDWHFVDTGLSFGILTILFAIIFKALPDVKIAWKSVWLGALLTSFLFHLGKYALSEYIARGSVANSYGAAGSLVVLLVWVYYSAQILFLGAEFTEVYTRIRHLYVVPTEDAEIVAHPPSAPKTAVEESVAANE